MSDDQETQARQSWELARGFAKLLLPAPPQLKDSNQILWKAHLASVASGEVVLPPNCSAVLKRIQPIAKLTTPIYFAAAAMYPDRMQHLQEDDTLKALLQLLQPGLFASILTTVYLHRRLNKIVTEIENPRMTELWEVLSEELILNMEIGNTVGSVIQGLGEAEGLLLGVIRFLALGPMLVLDLPFYDKYRGKKRGKLDRAAEQARFGFDHSQIAALLLTEFGFWDNAVEAAMVFRDEDWGGLKPPGALRTWKAGFDWIESARKGVCPPIVFCSSDRFELGEERVEQLARDIDSIHENGTSFSWMMRTSKNGMSIDAPPPEGAAEESPEEG